MKIKKPEIARYIYTDERLLNLYFDQVISSVSKKKKRHFEVSLSMSGPSIKMSTAEENPIFNNHEKIGILEHILEFRKLLWRARPVHIDESRRDSMPLFVQETMLATRLFLPTPKTPQFQDLMQASVWISDPDPTVFSDEEYTWNGSFLYLTQFQWQGGRSTFISGLSALQFLVNLVTDGNHTPFARKEFEPFGRGRDLHPIEKLKDIGSHFLEKRMITSLYEIRYFTNEQVYTFNGKSRRVNDILGYPIYISASP